MGLAPFFAVSGRKIAHERLRPERRLHGIDAQGSNHLLGAHRNLSPTPEFCRSGRLRRFGPACPQEPHHHDTSSNQRGHHERSLGVRRAAQGSSTRCSASPSQIAIAGLKSPCTCTSAANRYRHRSVTSPPFRQRSRSELIRKAGGTGPTSSWPAGCGPIGNE